MEKQTRQFSLELEKDIEKYKKESKELQELLKNALSSTKEPTESRSPTECIQVN